MKRSAFVVLLAAPLLSLAGGMAYADLAAITPMPYAPDGNDIVGRAEGVATDLGLPIDLPVLPTVDLPDLPVDVAAVEDAVATVENTVAGLDLPIDTPSSPDLGAVPGVGGLVVTAAATDVPDAAGALIATVQQTVAGLGLPIEVPDLPVDVTGVLGTVTGALGGLPL